MMKFYNLILIIPVLFLSACAGSVTNSDIGLLKQVNTQINSEIKYEAEKKDVWHTYDQVLKTHKGDCEEFAISKCTILKNHLPNKDLLIIIAKSLSNTQAHAVLLVKNTYVLDNANKDVYFYRDFLKKWKPKFALEDCANEEIKTIKGAHL